MTGASASQTGLSSPTEPSSTVSALTGFDPSRKSDVFSVQMDLKRRAAALDSGIDATKALYWLHEYGRGVAAGGTYGKDFNGYADAAVYLQEAQQAFGQSIFDEAISRALADVEAAYASAIEARRAETQGGSVADESAVPNGEAPNG